jgi:hypothetical protein
MRVLSSNGWSCLIPSTNMLVFAPVSDCMAAPVVKLSMALQVESRQVTHKPHEIASAFTWSPDGKFIAHVRTIAFA